MLHRLSELGQGGIDRLNTLETLFAALPESPEKAAAQTALFELHTYGAEAYMELGLKLKTSDTFTGKAGEVKMFSGGTGEGGKNPPSPPGDK